MTQQHSHLEAKQLSQWLADNLLDDEVVVVEQHLSDCGQCAELLEGLQTEIDPMVVRMRQAYAAAAFHSNTIHTLGSERSTYLERASIAGATHFEAAPPTPEGDDRSTRVEEGAVASEDISPSPRSMKRWQIETLLGAGGIGEVWAAHDNLLGRKVALKRLRYKTAQSIAVQRRFLYEARITSQLSHPGTVHVLDLIEDGAESYYVMSLIEGETLREIIANAHSRTGDSKRPLHGQLLPMLRHWVGIARTIAYAHSQGIVHRDLKSDNVIVGRYGQVTVIDWGLAKRFEDEDIPLQQAHDDHQQIAHSTDSGLDTQPGVRLGTPSFMAPEQAVGNSNAVNERSDVWGLAAILYEILTGRPPFVGGSAAEIMRKVINEPVQSPSKIKPAIPPELSDICEMGLSKNPRDRFKTATVFANRVEEWMNTESTRRQSEETRHRLFDVSNDLMVVFNHTPEVLWVNSAWTRILGWQPEDLLGKQPNIVAHPDEIRRDFAILRKLSKGEIASGHERRTQLKDGSYRWYSWSLTPVPEEGIICAIGRDIDARRKSEEEYLAIFNATPDATVVTNEQGRIYLVNEQLIELLGYERDELVGESIAKFLPHENEQLLSSCVSKLVRQKNGSEFHVAIHVCRLELPSGVRLVASLRKS